MKHLIIVTVITLGGFTSCQKEYTCVCRSGDVVTSSERIKAMLGDAREECDKNDRAAEGAVVSTECELE